MGTVHDNPTPAAEPALPELAGPARLVAALSPVMVALMDELAQTMFCAKDLDGRYVAVNRVFVARTSARSRRDVVGRTAHDLFVPQLAERYARQDAEVIRTGRPLRNELELIRRLGGTPGWFLTSKHPVRDARGLVGLVSVSQDLHESDADDATMDSMARLVAAVEQHLDGPLPTTALAALAGCTPDVLTRRVRRVFSLTPRQLVLRARVDRATTLLTETDVPVSAVAAQAGFYDQPSFTRTFARLTGETPASFRRRSRA
ncbi:AraC family transcriptional regulator [Sediminihabitans luteus]|uniref:AraC family transcriptional regulator n=1 Tax=Sediminihabitans luteus TaxID=1138585 RepID=A0A2M9CDL4_9CELL|nr:AraC family transcriptional regulator [Sediminihabitans luteus]PJJ69952.1 AraC family transcriptional regulator [Sediminihabitans luteus]GII99272.1 transcriptional regulator [Sediminihabitans luteus]